MLNLLRAISDVKEGLRQVQDDNCEDITKAQLHELLGLIQMIDYKDFENSNFSVKDLILNELSKRMKEEIKQDKEYDR